MLDDAGHPEIEQIVLFSRASDASIACAQANALTLRDAEMQFIGSKYLSHQHQTADSVLSKLFDIAQ
jgi:catabolite regulation protein CreA